MAERDPNIVYSGSAVASKLVNFVFTSRWYFLTEHEAGATPLRQTFVRCAMPFGMSFGASATELGLASYYGAAINPAAP